MKTMIQEILAMTDELGAFCLKPHARFFRIITGCKTASFYATLNNLVEAGLLRKKQGEKTVFTLTEAGRSRLAPTRAFPIRRRRGWDGKFRLLTFTIPEERRRDRDDLRIWLRENGFGMLHSSVWILPHDLHHEQIHWLENRGYVPYVLFFTADQVRFANATEIFRKAWDLGAVRKLHLEFIADKKRRVHRFLIAIRGMEEASWEGLIRWMIRDLDESYAEVFHADPFLPREFLPRPWPGNTARALYRRLRRKLTGKLAEI